MKDHITEGLQLWFRELKQRVENAYDTLQAAGAAEYLAKNEVTATEAVLVQKQNQHAQLVKRTQQAQQNYDELVSERGEIVTLLRERGEKP